LSKFIFCINRILVNQKAADGRIFKEHVRDYYEKLMALNENAKMETDKRTELTEDERADVEQEKEKRRKFISRAPPNVASRRHLLSWLSEARKRLQMRHLTRGVRESSRRLKCDLCEKLESEVGLLRIDEATDGRYNPTALSSLIDSFISSQERMGFSKTGPLDVAAWKSFYRNHAVFIMRCEFCISNKAETARLIQQVRKFGPEARFIREKEREIELAVQGLDEDDDLAWDPVVVDRNKPAGRALSKWIQAARLRIGGTFPKAEARQEMEIQAQLNADIVARRKEKLEKARGRAIEKGEGLEKPVFDMEVKLDRPSIAVLQLFVFKARRNLAKLFHAGVSDTLGEIEKLAREMAPSLDWHFSAELRLTGIITAGKGQEAKERLEKILEDRRTLESYARKMCLRDNTILSERISKHRDELRRRLGAQEVIYSPEEVRKVVSLTSAIDTLKKSLETIPGTSAAAMDTRHRIKTLENQLDATRHNAVADKDNRQLRMRFEGQRTINGAEAKKAENVVARERKIADTWSSALVSMKLSGAEYLAEAKAWLIIAREKVKDLPEARKKRSLLGTLPRFLGLSPKTSPASSPRATSPPGTPRSPSPSPASSPTAISPHPGLPRTPRS